MRKAVSFFLLIGFVGTCLAQGSQFNHTLRNYSPANGLPQSQVHTVMEDGNGYLWIGTEGGGLARFDGREFKVFTTLDGLLTNFVTGLRFDNHKNLWILHPQGVTRFDGLRFHRFEPSNAQESFKRLRRLYIINDTVITVSAKGTIGKIYQDSVYYWDNSIVPGAEIYLGHQAEDGKLCFFLGSAGLYVYDGVNSYSVTLPATNFKIVNLFNHGQEVWLKSNYGLFRINFEKRGLEKLPDRSGHFVLLYDKVDNVFWTRNRNMLFKEKYKDDVLIRCDTVLRNVEVSNVILDSEGNTWFATNGSGLYKYFVQDFDQCGSDRLLGVMAILVDSEGTRWIGSMTNGLWKIKQGKIRSYQDKHEVYRNTINAIVEGPDKTVWVASAHGLGKYDREKDKFRWFTVKDGLSSNFLLNLAFDKHGVLWIGTTNGLNYFDDGVFKQFNPKHGFKAKTVLALHYSLKHETLFAGSDFGVNAIKDKQVRDIYIPEFKNTRILTIQPFADSRLLVASAGAGLAVVDPVSGMRKVITTRDGLASDFIYFAGADEENNIWVGTERGITRLRMNKDLEIEENLYYDESNGLTGMETNQNAFYLSAENKYFGLIDGLYEFNNVDRKSNTSFDLHLTDVKIFYGEYSPRDFSDSLTGFFKIPYYPVLPPDKNHVTFQFNRVDKRYPKSVKFKYYLENFDKTWSQPSSMNQVTYSNLPPGDYVFRVMATNSSGSWSETKVEYPFTVLLPFYQRASFIAGVLILIAGAVTFAMYMRVKQRIRSMIETERIRQREQEMLRKEIARDFHDDMGNQLTRIINYISLMKLNGRGENGQHDLYSKVEESAKYLYTGTRDFIWSIDPVNDELTKLFIHVRDFGEKLFEEKNISFRAFNELKEPVKLPYGFSREANLIFKEAMTNAFKYSQAENVTLTLRQNADEGFEMSLEDDGVGFNQENIQKKNGLKNIWERAERIGAVLRIQSKSEQGTAITLNFKLKTSKYGIAL